MKIDPHVIQQLSAWISERGIDLLELTTPETSLSLQRGSSASPTNVLVKKDGFYELKAPSPGLYLDRHPLSAQPLVSSGASIEAGQLVGFLQIRSLLLPLRSAEAGRVVSLPQDPGVTVGYGTVVMSVLTAGRS
jgi:acetyl-CoA carboxylase biotin carboxyl carrier protein